MYSGRGLTFSENIGRDAKRNIAKFARVRNPISELRVKTRGGTHWKATFSIY